VDVTRTLKVVFSEALINTHSSQVAIVNDTMPALEDPMSLLRRLMRKRKNPQNIALAVGYGPWEMTAVSLGAV
jgi:hypothetical protein